MAIMLLTFLKPKIYHRLQYAVTVRECYLPSTSNSCLTLKFSELCRTFYLQMLKSRKFVGYRKFMQISQIK